MSICFYDNIEIRNEPNIIIDRVYCLDFHKFNKDTRDRLAEIYSKLPAQIIIENIGQQCWFGEEGKSQNYLYSSVEPSGLQVVGVLKANDWFTWEGIFNELINDLPFFEC